MFQILTGAVAHLQMVQNAAACLLTKTKCREYVTPVLASLHHPPLECRILYKIFVITCQALGEAPEYIFELLCPYSNLMSLRSANQCLMDVPRAYLKMKGDQVFGVFPPNVWNRLPLAIRSSNSTESF